MARLIGETQYKLNLGERVPIRVLPETRNYLRYLLYAPEMRGVGYSEFIDRAVYQAWEEIETERMEKRLKEEHGRV